MLCDFSVYVENDAGEWKCVIGQHGDANLMDS